MNAVEIEQAITELAEQPFDAAEFPFVFLEAFGNKATTIKKLRSGTSNKSDIDGVLQANHIHLKTCDVGQVADTLTALRDSKATETKRNKVRFLLATDGEAFEAEDLSTGETVSCTYEDFPNHFVFFWPLAGLSKTKQLSESEFDVRATLRLNKLYTTLRADNPEWGTAERSADMNHFMARLIFLFFAEDTDILNGDDLFTTTIEQMSNADGSNTHEIISELFRAMDTPIKDRAAANLPRWADVFPYVNGGLFSGRTDVPKFSRIAQRYLTHIGNLNWTKINPDIFGSMIQAVADEDERSALGMHYTSVPNILKVLNPLFLDDLRDHLDRAGDNKTKLLNLRKRMSNIRVFDPACGSGNFLVIAYKQMREIEFEINKRRGEEFIRSDIRIQNFRGIELRDFSAEIARLALIIAEYQCDVTYRGQKDALAEFLPLDRKNWITCGNALKIDWLSVCPPTGTGVKVRSTDLFDTPLKQAEIDFENEGGETYICGNPPYKGTNWRSKAQTAELGAVLDKYSKQWKSLDYVNGWMVKAAEYSQKSRCSIAFVTTNSICQGQQAAVLWPIIYKHGLDIYFAHRSFKWANLASHNAGVSVVIVGMKSSQENRKSIFEEVNGALVEMSATNINGYLLDAPSVHVNSSKSSLGMLNQITDGSGALDGGHLILTTDEANSFKALPSDVFSKFIRPYQGSSEFIKGTLRFCLWITDAEFDAALKVPEIRYRVAEVKAFRQAAGSRAKTAVDRPHKFAWINKQDGNQIIVPTVFSEKREYLTAGFLSDRVIISNAASIVQDADLATFAVLSSKLHIEWVRSVAGKLEDRLRYTSSTCYNTFPVPKLTEKNKADLSRCAEDILMARESHFPATIADLYKPDAMPENLREAHDRNDEVLERIYIGRRFKNDTERLEKLFEMYTKMTTEVPTHA
ncbi:MAG: class I SAM-dependent DNA methyltransferase [Rhodobacteraceae bacterium]|nr:class I SAM-dependent DNA methyltransferase [Paracoccaceae bacterium]